MSTLPASGEKKPKRSPLRCEAVLLVCLVVIVFVLIYSAQVYLGMGFYPRARLANSRFQQIRFSEGARGGSPRGGGPMTFDTFIPLPLTGEDLSVLSIRSIQP